MNYRKRATFGDPPWPLVLKLAWHGEPSWSVAAKVEMERRFPDGMPQNWLVSAVEWYGRNIE